MEFETNKKIDKPNFLNEHLFIDLLEVNKFTKILFKSY